jgi:hypothetical protein
LGDFGNHGGSGGRVGKSLNDRGGNSGHQLVDDGGGNVAEESADVTRGLGLGGRVGHCQSGEKEGSESLELHGGGIDRSEQGWNE